MLEYFLCLNLLMVTRLIYLRNDEAIGTRWNLWLSGAQLLLVVLCFSFTAGLWLVLLLLLIAGGVNLLLEARLLKKGLRIGIFVFLIVGIDLAAAAGGGLQLRPTLVDAATLLAGSSGLLQAGPGISGVKLLGVLFGLLMLANEVNLFIRMVFRHFGMEPSRDLLQAPADAATHGIDRQEYNTGRVIGILERWLMYMVVLSTGSLEAIAFIIAAKGLARMKQLDDKVFAEYMLIGTFLSMISAVLVGSWVSSL